MKLLKSILLIVIITVLQTTNAQTAIFLGSGIAAYGEPGDGFILSSELQVPIHKTFSISPGFSIIKPFEAGNVRYGWDNEDGIRYLEGVDNLDENINIHLFANLRPFAFFKSDKWQKIDLKLSVGYGVTYSSSFSYYTQYNNMTVIDYKYKTIYGFIPRISYTYHYSERLLFAIATGYTYSTVDEIAYLSFQVGFTL